MDLLEACENGNEERVLELLLSPTGAHLLEHEADRAGRRALHAACMGGQLSVVQLLLGRACQVFFPGRSRDQVEELVADASGCTVMGHVTMKRRGESSVPAATVQLAPPLVIPREAVLTYVDMYGNTPMQCIACFGCGSEAKHVTEGVEIATALLQNGCPSNTPKAGNNWTPLHWSAFHGNHELAALLLHPDVAVAEKLLPRQVAVPLARADGFYAADIAGRVGLNLANEMAALRGVAKSNDANATTPTNLNATDDEDGAFEYRQWRLRLDHVL
ncbi:hypothetical protein As57867_007090, partial [Aphanomyces stellatus]